MKRPRVEICAGPFVKLPVFVMAMPSLTCLRQAASSVCVSVDASSSDFGRNRRNNPAGRESSNRHQTYSKKAKLPRAVESSYPGTTNGSTKTEAMAANAASRTALRSTTTRVGSRRQPGVKYFSTQTSPRAANSTGGMALSTCSVAKTATPAKATADSNTGQRTRLFMHDLPFPLAQRRMNPHAALLFSFWFRRPYANGFPAASWLPSLPGTGGNSRWKMPLGIASSNAPSP